MDRTKDAGRKMLGEQGERIASEFLQERGCSVLRRNYRSAHREIDIVARQGNDLRFVEVKTRKEPVQGEAWEAVNLSKQRNVARAAKAFLARECGGMNVDECHFDVVTIVWDRFCKEYKLEYFPDAFYLIYV